MKSYSSLIRLIIFLESAAFHIECAYAVLQCVSADLRVVGDNSVVVTKYWVIKYEHIYWLYRQDVCFEPECFLHGSMIVTFLLHDAMFVWYMLSLCVGLSVCPSVCHVPVLYQNGSS